MIGVKVITKNPQNQPTWTPSSSQKLNRHLGRLHGLT